MRSIATSWIEHKALVPSEGAISSLIEAADEGFKQYLIVSCLGRLRASDLRGPCWQEVAFDGGFLHIRHRADAYNHMFETKSRAGLRDVPAGPMVLNTLRHRKRRCPKSDLGQLFPAPRGGILEHTDMKARFRKLQKKARRQCACTICVTSLWIGQGFSTKKTMTFVNHSSIQMTKERYGHLFL